MKTSVKILSLCIAFLVSSWLLPQKAKAQNVTFQVFYDELSPYGQWINDPNYGYVWVPNISSGFTPYSTNGYWIYTESGWTWVSNYSWGWAPFHYGRWNYVSSYGWAWIPDTEWAPAWVSWRSSPGYYGWAPLPWGNTAYDYNPTYWRFIRCNDFGRTNQYHYYVNRANYGTIYKNSNPFNGPDIVEVRRLTGRPFRAVTIANYNRPGHHFAGNTYNIYRPRVDKSGTPANAVDPANYGGVKTQKNVMTPGKANPANYGGANTQPGTRPSNSPNPANYGGVKPQQKPSPPVNKPNPANYGGANTPAQNTTPTPVKTPQQNTPPPVNRPNPANYGGAKKTTPKNTAPPANRPNPANYGGARTPAQRPAAPVNKPAPNPANYGGVKRQ